jgi:hypothetical protein
MLSSFEDKNRDGIIEGIRVWGKSGRRSSLVEFLRYAQFMIGLRKDVECYDSERRG